MDLLKDTLKNISGPDQEAKIRAREKWDGLIKPIGSLGDLEEVTIKIAGMTGRVVNKIDKRAVVVMCSDNGVVEEGVSSAPQIFTKVLTESMANGITGLASLAKHSDTDVVTVDLGVIGDMENPKILDRKISEGTKNFIKGPAMTYEEAVRAIEVGIEIGDSLYGQGYDILGTGELGIGNTTTAAAVVACLSDLDIDLVCGKGAGLTDDQHKHKKDIITRAIALNKPNKSDPIDVIAKVGGYDIGAMCGLFLSAAKNKKPIVMDGFISYGAALSSIRLNEEVSQYIIPSHLSAEPGSKYIFEELKMKPILDLRMRLGEGTGCPLAFKIIEAATYSLENMGTFEDISMSSDPLVNIRED